MNNLSSFEQELPVELSFLIRQQAYCMARMNYLDRQIRELRESNQNGAQQAASPVASASVNRSANQNQSHANRHMANNNANTSNNNITNNNNNNLPITHTKHGNFIPSDDSGGEYSRATNSDDDELSSLLDQIAKSVRPERNIDPNVKNMPVNNSGNIGAIPARNNFNVINQQPQQYTIINPNQLHHQAMPVFVMSSPIAVAHPSSISSTVLPGVHFQPEPRYNQYYEDLYVQNNSSNPTLNRHTAMRSQQFDSSISTLERLVSQKEKRQIKSQLKSADNWFKMRSSGLCNSNGNFNSYATINNETINGGDVNSNDRNMSNLATSNKTTPEGSNNVIEEGNRAR